MYDRFDHVTAKKKTMTFEEASKAIVQGKMVRCVAWPKGSYLSLGAAEVVHVYDHGTKSSYLSARAFLGLAGQVFEEYVPCIKALIEGKTVRLVGGNLHWRLKDYVLEYQRAGDPSWSKSGEAWNNLGATLYEVVT